MNESQERLELLLAGWMQQSNPGHRWKVKPNPDDPSLVHVLVFWRAFGQWWQVTMTFSTREDVTHTLFLVRLGEAIDDAYTEMRLLELKKAGVIKS